MELLAVNRERLRQRLRDLALIGCGEDQGIYRRAFSDADMEARTWLRGEIEAAGLEAYQDGAANLHARLRWDPAIPSVITGSHMDSVPGGGQLDGALGVIAGLECLQSLKESGLTLKRPLESIAFSDEEGRFGGMLGSAAFCGRLSPESLHGARDLDGISLSEAMAAQGLNAMDALGATRPPETIHAFVELHIEQGPILDNQNLHLGVVDSIAGLFKWNICLDGTAAHAGATPMALRQDAFQGLAEFSGELERILEEHGSPRSVATIGRVELSPGAANVVPGRVEFSLDTRDPNPETLEALGNAMRRSLSAIARRRRLMFNFDVLSEITPVKCAERILKIVDNVASNLGINHTRMTSGAAHDTQLLAGMTEAGLIFVPSKEGRSHSPAEWTDWQDIENGANALLNTLYQLAVEP